jgi:hypothetical protein
VFAKTDTGILLTFNSRITDPQGDGYLCKLVRTRVMPNIGVPEQTSLEPEIVEVLGQYLLVYFNLLIVSSFVYFSILLEMLLYNQIVYCH